MADVSQLLNLLSEIARIAKVLFSFLTCLKKRSNFLANLFSNYTLFAYFYSLNKKNQMNNLENIAQKTISSTANKLKEKGYTTSAPVKRQYCFEVTVSNESDRIKLLVYFGKKGIKSVIQGNKDLPLYQEVSDKVFGPALFENKIEEIGEPSRYIGTDESGKGDYFGPLVIGSVFVNPETLKSLKKIGVKDSKELSDNSIKYIAGEIKKVIKNQYSIIEIKPKKYNELHSKVKNVNRILGWAHAKALENLLEIVDCQEAVSDKFGDESLIRNSLQEKGKSILLHQFTKAERFTAVAAASILAREKFIDWFEIQNKKLGMILPKGAPAGIEKYAIQIKKQFGDKILNDLVKLHFKTTNKVFLT